MKFTPRKVRKLGVRPELRASGDTEIMLTIKTDDGDKFTFILNKKQLGILHEQVFSTGAAIGADFHTDEAIANYSRVLGMWD